MFPSESTATPFGGETGLIGVISPSVLILAIRLLLVSATYTFPAESTAIPFGLSKLEGPNPVKSIKISVTL